MLITDFNEYVYKDVRGCPTNDVTDAVRDAATEFLTYTGAWREVQDPIQLQDDQHTYDLEPVAGTKVIDILNVYASFATGGELKPKTLDQVRAIWPNWDEAEGSLPTVYTRAFDYTSIRVFPIPTDVNGAEIRMHAIYTLTRTATSIPDVIVDRYRDAITSGALKRLLSMARTPWQDLKLAQYHSQQFESAKQVARITTRHQNTAGHVVVPPRKFGF